MSLPSMGPRLIQWIDLWIPAGLTPGRLERERLYVQVVTVGLVATSMLATFNLAVGQWVPAGITSTLLGLLLAGLFALRNGLAFPAVVHATVALLVLMLTLANALRPDLDFASLAWFVVIPFLVVVHLEARSALAWALGVSCLVVALVAAHPYLPHVGTAYPSLVLSTFRLLMLVPTLLVFGIRFDQERRRSMEAAEAASRAKSAFLAHVSHEIRTPMNGVLGMAEVMLQEEEESLAPKHREQLRLIQRSGLALVALVNDILDLSKIEAGKLRLEPVDFDLREVVEDVARLFTPIGAQKGLTVELTLAPDVPRLVRGDALRLRQVLCNLCNNAVKFTEQGTVSLGVRCLEPASPSGRLRFSVQDTGVGIAPELFPRLFQAYEQGRGANARGISGTGLGLALSREFVSLLGGTLQAESTEGQGAHFFFDVAFAPPKRAAPATAQPAAGLATLSHLRVLVVDDNAINVRVACGLLRALGIEAQTATNGQEAVDAVARGGFSLVLMDCHMPVLDGFQATERIRMMSGPVSRVPVVALTASALREEIEACARSGMNECLTKPVSLRELERVIRTLVPPAPA